MKIKHIAIWTNHLEQMKAFYEKYFQAVAGRKYTNPAKHFESNFLSFSSGARLELMTRPVICENQEVLGDRVGYAHLSFSAGSIEAVDELTEGIRQGSFGIVDSPRRTGDGTYESVILDPDRNQVEITI